MHVHRRRGTSWSEAAFFDGDQLATFQGFAFGSDPPCDLPPDAFRKDYPALHASP